ncbi:SEC-C metal-binding domain-containing protein [Kribbella sp. GL6]|uniref:tetratricopeptide repeat protein n=1 Tax=Kribbella sp. GL6 TaxID=3419765 RepID=UPI003CFCF0FB
MSAMLSTEDIDRIAEEAIDSETPGALAVSLIDAVENGRVADQTDIGYALTVAAEITSDTGDAETSIALAERAIEAYERSEGTFVCHPAAVRADALFQAGRDEEAMTQLSALRERLAADPDAPMLVGDVLVSNGLAETAEEWLTEALDEVLRRHGELESTPSDPTYDDVATLAFELLQARHGVRHELGLPHDDHDELADELMENLEDSLEDESALLFLPQREYEEALRRWPELAVDHGATWDEHRAATEQELRLRAEHGAVRLAVVPGSADGLAEFATMDGTEQLVNDAVQAYSDSLAESNIAEVNWPPGRNDPCWCGSTSKYKKCCLPRAH